MSENIFTDLWSSSVSENWFKNCCIYRIFRMYVKRSKIFGGHM